MNTRFYLIIALLVILYGAWTFLEHTHGSSAASRYEALSRLPVYAYIADTTMVNPILQDLKGVPSIASMEHETGFDAAMELISSYSLPLSDNMIADYNFPDVITIKFKPIHATIQEKARVMDILRSRIGENDIDSQSGAFSEIVKEISWIKFRTIAFTIYAGVMMLLIFLFSRLSYELHIYLKQKRKLVSVVDIIRHNKLNASHTWMMLLFPVSFVAAVYYGGWYLGKWQNLAVWWSFAAMAGSSILGTMIIYFSLRVYEHDSTMQETDVVIVTPPKQEEDNVSADS